MTIIDRRSYVTHQGTPKEKAAIHRAYYAQFVTEQTKREVLRLFSVEELRKSLAKDPHLNEGLPLRRWNALCFTNPRNVSGPFHALLSFDREKRSQADPCGVTRSDLVCIAKEAATQLVEEASSNG